MNIPRVRSRQILENMTAIKLGLTGEPEEVGQLRIISGEDVRTVGKWVQKERMARREKELESRSNHGS